VTHFTFNEISQCKKHPYKLNIITTLPIYIHLFPHFSVLWNWGCEFGSWTESNRLFTLTGNFRNGATLISLSNLFFYWWVGSWRSWREIWDYFCSFVSVVKECVSLKKSVYKIVHKRKSVNKTRLRERQRF